MVITGISVGSLFESFFRIANPDNRCSWIANPAELGANCQIQNYDNFTRASARWKLKNYGNYGNFCRFFMKYYDYYEYFFQKNDHREPSPVITTTPPPPYPKKGYLPTPKPPPDIGRGLNRSYSSLIH